MVIPPLSDEITESMIQRGVALAKNGAVDDAIAVFREAIQRSPRSARAHHNLAIALAEKGLLTEAVANLTISLELFPTYADAHYNLGNLLNRLNRADEAMLCLRKSVMLRPSNPEALNNLALGLIHSGSADEAIVLIKHALRLRPDFAEAMNNLGLAFHELGEYDKAIESYEMALEVKPEALETLGNLANCYKDAGQLSLALATFDLALAYNPDQVSTRWNRSLCLLHAGDFERGWTEYEWRLKKPEISILKFPQPMWDGAPLQDRTILLHAEQGWGDILQFIRFAAHLQRQGARVIFLCPRQLVSLLSRSPGIDEIIPDGSSVPPFDVHAPLMSLPKLLKTTIQSVPREVPYILPDPGCVEVWERRIETVRGFKVGICWQGNPKHRLDRVRSVAAAEYSRLASVPDVALISVQQIFGLEQLAELKTITEIVDLTEQLRDEHGSFQNVSALLPHLDLVITVDTAIAHLAGAMGIPTWILLAAHSDWRWMSNRSDSPWYPTAKLFRQKTLGDWSIPFEQLRQELETIVPRRRGSRESANP